METLKLTAIAVGVLVAWFVVSLAYVTIQHRIVTGRWPTE